MGRVHNGGGGCEVRLVSSLKGGPMRWLGQKWEWIKALAIVLCPIRFILLIKLVMIGILSLPQAKDALYGAVTEEGAWRAASVFIAVTA